MRVDREGRIDVDGVVEVSLMDDCVAESSRHLLVDLSDDLLGVFASSTDLSEKKFCLKFNS